MSCEKTALTFVKDHHGYKFVWTPVIGEELHLQPEESNERDEYAVAVRKDGETVGHAPRYPALIQTPGV